MRINNNIMALNTHRQFSVNNESVSKATEKLSSGFRINRAGDDAAGLAISEKMRAQIRGLEMAAKNSQDAISLVQTAEGALTETHAILQSMRELAVQSASDTNEDLVDRAALDAVFQQLKAEIDDIANQTKFNDMHLLDGSFGSIIGAEADSSLIEGNIASVTVTGAKNGDQFSFVQVTDGADFDIDGDSGAVSFTTGGAYKDLGKLMSADDFAGLAANDIIVLHQTPALDENGEAIDGVFENTSYAIISGGAATAVNGKVDIDKLGISIELAEGQTALAGADFAGKTITIGEVPGTGGQIQTGANQGDNLHIEIGDMSAGALEIATVSITAREDAGNAVSAVNSAINKVSTQRANLGAYQNRLEHKINNLNTSAENLQAAESRIRDLDIAKEMTAFTRNSILVQASTAMLAQANAAPQAVLSLLR